MLVRSEIPSISTTIIHHIIVLILYNTIIKYVMKMMIKNLIVYFKGHGARHKGSRGKAARNTKGIPSPLLNNYWATTAWTWTLGRIRW